MMDSGISQENMPILSNTDDQHLERCPLCGLEPICGGLGLVRYDVPVDDPRFGKMFRCPNNPPERDQDWHSKLRQVSNLSSLADKTFDNFVTNANMHTEKQQEILYFARNTARKFAQHMDGWLMLQGTYGCGKTHLAAAVGNYRLAQGDAVLFITVPDLLDHLRAAYGPTSEIGYDETFVQVRNAPLLILDDLGVENPSPWAQEKLFQLLNHRYVNQLPTVITTNVNMDQFDPRIHSRLTDIALVHRIEMDVPDYRNILTRAPEDQLITDLALYQDRTFETFDYVNHVLPDERRNLEMVSQRVYEYAIHPDGWLVLLGMPGAGKTHLAAAAAHVLQHNGHEVVFLTAPDLLDYLRTTFNPDSRVTFSQRFQMIKDVAVLVLDDLNTENATPWAQEKLFQILDYRYIRRLPTIITTRKDIKELDVRLRSRILDDRICYLVGIAVRESYAMRRRRR